MKIRYFGYVIIAVTFLNVMIGTIFHKGRQQVTKYKDRNINITNIGISTVKNNKSTDASGTKFNVSSGQYPQKIVTHIKTIPKSIISNGLDTVLTKRTLSIFIDLIEKFVEICEHNYIPYMMYGGTLIGSYRHHGPIPWDDDVDFWIPYSHLKMFEKAMAKCAYKYKLIRGFRNRSKFFSYDSYKHPNGNVFWNWPYLDIFYYLKNETHIWDSFKFFEKFVFKNDDVFPLIRRPFLHLMLNAPYNTRAVLTQTYNIQDCKPRGFDHSNEIHLHDKKSLPCENLHEYYPFVFREQDKKTQALMEALKHSGKTIQKFSFHPSKYNLLTFWKTPSADFISYFTI